MTGETQKAVTHQNVAFPQIAHSVPGNGAGLLGNTGAEVWFTAALKPSCKRSRELSVIPPLLRPSKLCGAGLVTMEMAERMPFLQIMDCCLGQSKSALAIKQNISCDSQNSAHKSLNTVDFVMDLLVLDGTVLSKNTGKTLYVMSG